MQPSKKLVVATTAVLCLSSVVFAAHAQGPVPIREESPGLLAQAPTPPALARLTAYGEFPGARMIDAEIRRESSDLLYSFVFKFEDHRDTEQVLIDAQTGQVMCVEYSVEQLHGGHFAITGPPELTSLVESSYRGARDLVDETAKHGRIVKCRLRVERSMEIYIFDVVVGEDRTQQQLLIDANTGALVSSTMPN
jgi:uncharacterized membrane protein YkoI